MFGFMNINMRMNKNNTQIIHNAVNRMHKGELDVNDILDSEELSTDIKSNTSQLAGFFNDHKNIRQLLDYITKEPLVDEQKTGHKFPYYACEILCSENPNILKNIFNEHKMEEEEYDDEEESKPNKPKKSDDDIDLDLEENFCGKKEEHNFMENKDDYIMNNDDKFRIENEDNGHEDINKINIMNEKQEEDDMVNFDIDQDRENSEQKHDHERSPFDKKEDSENNRYGDNDVEDLDLNNALIIDSDVKEDKEEKEDEKDNKEKVLDFDDNLNDSEENKQNLNTAEDSTKLTDDSDQELANKNKQTITNDDDLIDFTQEKKTDHEEQKENDESNTKTLEENQQQEKSHQENKLFDLDEVAENKDKDGDQEVMNDQEKQQLLVDVSEFTQTMKQDKLKSMSQSNDLSNDLSGHAREINEEEEIEENIHPEHDESNEADEHHHKKRKISHRKDSLNLSQDRIDSELLDYFFTFLDTTEQLNFVLAGYFAKVFGHFLNNRQACIMRYVLVGRPEIMNLFVRHINRKSIIECIYKILISFSDDIPNALELKISFLQKIIDAFDPEDEEIVTNVCDLILDMFTVRKMYVLIITNKNIFKMIFDFVLGNINNNSFKHLIKILIKANENILKDFGTNLVTPTFTCNETQELFFNFTYNVSNLVSGNTTYNSQAEPQEDPQINIQNLQQQFQLIFATLTQSTEIILNNFVEQDNKEQTEMETTFGINVKMLGTKRLLEIEYIRSIMEILVNAYANEVFSENLDLYIIEDKIIESKFFASALKNLYLYEFNSIYQKEFENVILLICNKHTPEKLVKHVLTESDLVHSIIENSIDSHFSFHSGRKIQSGFFVTVFELASIITDSENVAVKNELEQYPKWKNFVTFYIDPIKQRFKEGLLAPTPQDVNNNNNNNTLGNFEKNFIEFKPFEQQEKEIEDTNKVPEQKKVPMKDFLKQSSMEYIHGRKIEAAIEHKKEEMEILHDEDEDTYQNYMNDIGVHPHVISYTEKNHSENHEFYDNNYWATNLIVDEVELQELTQSL